MDRPLISAYYYATYYYASVVRNVLDDQFSYLRHLDSFYGDDKYLAYAPSFRRFSALHSFIEFLVDEVITEETANVGLDVMQDTVEQFSGVPGHGEDLTELPIEHAFKAHGIQEQSFVAWLSDQGIDFMDATDNHLYEFMNELRLGQGYETLLWQITQEVFFVLFQNRGLLLLFNEMMARQVQGTDYELLEESQQRWFRRDGYLKRAPIPRWAMRAVFFRDRGLCVLCRRDLSGVLNIWSTSNYDHIVALGTGGLNDVSNLQLLCAECNKKKSAGAAATSPVYEAWYDTSPASSA